MTPARLRRYRRRRLQQLRLGAAWRLWAGALRADSGAV